ncbi:GMP synthase (glutamine-hydrolyzing) domain-containing protein, partial [Phytophthora cinnamomi]|uniref:GMP synthase (glutamine-hydrolyzing) domain-containing protein n=1 Tax=Phytophthora cinnamomi TaxID=4785 RepID=UPI00355988AF
MRSIADAFIEEVRGDRRPRGPRHRRCERRCRLVRGRCAAAARSGRPHAVLIDNGLLRKDEATEVVDRLQTKLGINLKCINASDRFLAALKGVTEPETKRKTIGNLFIELFQEEAERIQPHPWTSCSRARCADV